MVDAKEEPEFDWLQFRRASDELNPETFSEKLMRRTKENPFVPIGALLTVGCLSMGLYSFRRGEKRMSQLMMRGRILAQGFTVAALIGGVALTAMKTNAK
ncbi:hypothetical protein AAG570_003142 [Ranatra chinensis]|uniref:HIG1 domain-containing protein n=1 Tax=Ranatra chinensis TaxID=642074 RepID=A0ABD0Y5Y9_9HEMI